MVDGSTGYALPSRFPKGKGCEARRWKTYESFLKNEAKQNAVSRMVPLTVSNCKTPSRQATRSKNRSKERAKTSDSNGIISQALRISSYLYSACITGLYRYRLIEL